RHEGAVLVEDEGEPARHAGGEVAAGGAEDDDGAAGHVLAAVVAHALDDGGDARVSHREALAGAPVEERAPGDRAVEDGVADDDLVVGTEGRAARRLDDKDAAGEPLADVVVGVALELEGDAAHGEGAEALPRRAAPRARRRGVSAGRPSSPGRRGISPESMAPTARSRLRIGVSTTIGSPRSTAGATAAMSWWSRTSRRLWSCSSTQRRGPDRA